VDDKIRKWENWHFPTITAKKNLIAKSVLINRIQIYGNKPF